MVVPAGTPFSTYLSELRLLLGNVRCAGTVAPEDGTLQIAIKTGVDDQFAGLGSQFFAGSNLRTLPFNSVDDLMGSSGDLALDQTRATASVCLSGGVATHNTSSRVYNHAPRGRQHGGIMSVEEDYFEDERKDFGRVHAIMRKRVGFGRNDRGPPFYVLFKTQTSAMLPAHHMDHAV